MQKQERREKNICRKVLVVDDEFINRTLLGSIVESVYDVLYAENGVQALELIRENERTLSLIMLDLLMPEMDGYELLKILQSDPELKRIPVIVLTSERSAEVESLKLGAADFIPKPYDMPEVILARVNRSIQLAEDSKIIRAAEDDDLTGLLTKEFFFQYAERRDRYNPDMKMDALVLNVNRFHLINELYGRFFGNVVLQTIARNILEMLEETDGLACRCNADIFYMYIPHREDHEVLLKKYADSFSSSMGNSRLSVRIGVYENVDMDIDVQQRFDRANIACSMQRSVYSTSYGFYDTRLHEKELYGERLINEMDDALADKDFKVFYQPKYNIKGDKPVLSSAEALVRWSHPELGMVSPGEFVPLFEKNGLIQKLDRYVWKEAAAQIKRWKDTYGVTVPVSVNVSRIDIFDPGLKDELLDIVRSNGLEPSEYLLEITESAYTDNSQQIIDTVQSLRAEGFHVEMDDFGSGYSSLNMLASLPIDALKLDMRFIKNICTSEKDRRMIQLVIDIAGFLDVPIIAEGVETEEQYRLLKEAGCDIIQGYYFSKPVPAEEFNGLIEKESK